MKTCRVCNQTKEIDCFYKQKSHKDGYMNTCSKCFNAKNRLYYMEYKCTPEHRIKQRERSRIYREKQKDNVLSSIP